MTINDLRREDGILVYDEGDVHAHIYKHTDMHERYTGLWMTDLTGPNINICATYPRRKDAINGLDKLLRVFE